MLASDAFGRRTTVLLCILKVLLSIPIFITAYVSADSCFLTSNSDGTCQFPAEGIESLFGIRNGLNFQMTTQSVATLTLSVVILKMLNNGTSSKNLGMATAFSIITCYVAMVNASFFHGFSQVVNTIDCENVNLVYNVTHYRCAKHVMDSAYSALAYIWGFYFFAEAAFVYSMWRYSDLFANDFDEDITAYGLSEI